MSLTNSRNPLALGAFVLFLAAVVGACSSSSTVTPDDGGVVGDAAHPPVRRDSGAIIAGNDAGNEASTGGAGFDGTTGQACQSNADCKGQSANAPGTNQCSNNYQFTGNGVTYNPWPTPVCILPLAAATGNCDAGSNGVVQFCDSADPTDPTSPGICVAITQGVGGVNSGTCLPACSYQLDPNTGVASPPSGCTGKDTCTPLTFELDVTSGAVTGFGICEGTCQTDADCAGLGATFVCQVDRGFCTATKKARTLPIGATCTNDINLSTSDYSKGSCFCPAFTSALGEFYCSSACVVGGNPCPTGFVCDSGEPSSLTFTGAGPGGTDLTLPGPPTPTAGTGGLCIQACSNPDGGAAPDGGACPANISTCQLGTSGGPDCFPPPTM
jgi:hypothetical protein